MASLTTWNGSKQITACGACARTDFANAGPRSIDTASTLDGPPSGRAEVKNASSVVAFLPGAPHTILPVSWLETSVRYLWCLRQEISSTPMLTSSLSRSGSSFSATTREHIAPTVRHVTRQNVDTVFLSHLPASQTARSSKSRVNP